MVLFWPLDGTLTGSTASGQSWSGSNDNGGVIPTNTTKIKCECKMNGIPKPLCIR